MSGYEVEHNIKDEQPQQPARRPDLSTFFSQLELVDTSDPSAHTNPNALPQPENMAAAFRLLANAFETMRGRPSDDSNGDGDLLANMIQVLRENADDPPTELKGVPDSFLDELERVPKKALKETDTCPICVNPFLEGPWLKLNSTCPLDRKELLKKKQPPPPPADDDEEEYDDMYA
ncbi:hypothetical protein A1F97_03023 [Pyrenophora tritici-repentis]|nr:hypothetical protein A1F97_03023 [Pyrenophora tritici-repentis]